MPKRVGQVHGGFDEDAYRGLLPRRAAAPGQLATELNTSAARVARALGRLHDRGLVGRLSGRRLRHATIGPHHTVDALIRSRNAELDRVRGAANQPARLFEAAQHGEAEEVEITQGSEALGRWFVRPQQEAREEVCTLDRPPYAPTTANPVEKTVLAEGMVYRAVYAPEALERPGVLDDIKHLMDQGEQARVLPGLRVKLAVADRRLSLMPLSLDLTDVRAATRRLQPLSGRRHHRQTRLAVSGAGRGYRTFLRCSH
ncbi:TrmB family transcriptional regulator [Streptomyces sp. NPDC058812]|uniref:TrmB family transcriptional regulator n=1 Tax=unclassified Streptomyces TaxID=2593676 RepID=UPI0036B662FA